MDKYSYRDHQGQYILCWDLGKYVNHSFHTNCLNTAYGFDIAVRSIKPGEELTNDYGMLNLDKPFFGLPEEGTKRSCAEKEDLLHFCKVWDQLLLETFAYFDKVEQPLKHLISKQDRIKIKQSVEMSTITDSVKSLYFGGESG